MLTRVAAATSIVALVLGFTDVFSSIELGSGGRSVLKITLAISFSIALLSLFYGNVVYQLTRIGQLKRHSGDSEDNSDRRSFEEIVCSPTVSILVPSYKEQVPVVMQTVISAALSEYPNRRITLLLDDPPQCAGADLLALSATRDLINELDETFAAAADRFRAAERDYLERTSSGSVAISRERQLIGALFDDAATVVECLGRRYAEFSQPAFAHADELFAREVIERLIREHRGTAAVLRNGKSIDAARLQLEYRRLAQLFAVPIGIFERKRFANLSHAPNKAMNLNSYIGLIGRTFRISKSANGALLLLETPASEAEFKVPNADYIITIDADSIILPDYVRKLVSIMEADRRIAIAQTPYSAYPGPPTVLERVAGATTDIQYLIHQGFTAYNATFWVGANAVLRREALDEIKTMTEERGHPIPIFIQDKTLIEDTGSTIDLAARGWLLHNHPERLAFSATPSDFGALVIQRRRWANGGLIIFPRLLELWRQSPNAGLLETIIRSHYLLSPALANIGLLLLLIIPFGSEFSSIWFPVAAAPYYLLYGQDLKRTGYKWRDLLRVYALTLLLVPVNLAGVYRSLEQMVTGRKSPFARTPKIEGRTAAPASHLLALCALTATAIFSAGMNLWSGNLLFFAFCGVNAGFFLYGFISLIGWREAAVDITAGLTLRISTRLASATT
ncbi:glycosyltransferase family 2 protein [Bradyrhizobium sp. CB3481]|uniref:glycosyltransferase family 2 protein n=1 Tax=Bradyrhizobium sp. CB3481 TaxID=3039158 RepID=UPI0024B09CDB|nr:glycosyltransferase family 2 protein [Bradyrhizobium sp. CB3481]WFU19000.1 glycosyltransferase family 2 protein [Bradyrhizobium sp. CB3481]